MGMTVVTAWWWSLHVSGGYFMVVEVVTQCGGGHSMVVEVVTHESPLVSSHICDVRLL